MRLNSKVTWGLAWAGLAVVVAVPSVDFLTGALGMKSSTAAVIAPAADPVRPAAVAPAAAPSEQKTAEVTTTITRTGVIITPASPVLGGATSSSTDPVSKYVSTGKALPDYISGGDSTASASAPAAPAASAPRVIAPGAAIAGGASSEEPTQVATVEPSAPLVAPVPFPGRPADVVRPKPAAPQQAPVIVNETALAAAQDDAPPTRLVVPDGPVPPAGIGDDWRAQRNARITRYLERNGLIDDGSTASVTVVPPPPSDSDYDPNGFYLSDGPNSARAARRARVEQMLQDDGDDSDVTWF